MLKSKSSKLISDDLNNSERIERKQIDNICDACSKLIQQCNKKDLKVADLKWQPHYSTVFKQLKSLLDSILSKDSSKTLDKLNSIPYLLSLKNNIFTLLNALSKFVIENGSLIGTKDHHLRRTFFVKVVHFQFLCHEIQGYFPGGVYSPSNVKISKSPARTWWVNNFGEEIFVNLDTFVAKFNEDYPFINQAEIFSFKSSINFTATNFITTFEFDLFTRLYSPWEMIQEAWRIIYTHPGYLHFSTYGDTKDILSRHLDRPGTYVFRVSCKDLGFWTIGYVKGSKDMGQIKVDKTNLIEALVEGQKKNIYLYPNGEYTNPDLSNLNQFRMEIVVKNEDLQLYDCFEDFKECKICREGEKDLQLESCGHQICHACFKMLRKYNKKLCPFCNQLILSTTKIVNIKNTSIYVDPNSGKKESSLGKSAHDSLYVDMSSDGSQNNLRPEEVSVELRSCASAKVANDSLYSNASDDCIELPTRVPPGPPRPPREKVNRFKVDVTKSEINYPPIKNNKNDEVSLNSSMNEQFQSVDDRSSIYAEMTSTIPSITHLKKDDEMYCEINDNEEDFIHKEEPEDGDEDGPTSNRASILYHPLFPNETSYVDEVYSTPNESNHQNNDSSPSIIAAKISDDVYCNRSYSHEDDDLYALPNDDFIERNNVSNKPIATIYHTSKDLYSNHFEYSRNEGNDKGGLDDSGARVLTTGDDIYSSPLEEGFDEVFSQPLFKADENSGKFDGANTSDDVYSSPLDENIEEGDSLFFSKEDVSTEESINISNEQVLTSNDNEITEHPESEHVCSKIKDKEHEKVREEVKGSNQCGNKSNDEMYSNPSDEADNILHLYPGLNDLFSNWSETDISRAMRVARNDEVLALDILLEFVPVK